MTRAVADLHRLPEDDRIALIAESATKSGRVIGFVVEDNAKADRYLAKLRAISPRLREIARTPLDGLVLVRIQPMPPEGDAGADRTTSEGRADRTTH